MPKARSIYVSALGRSASLDWPEAVFDAFLTFEEYHGSLETLFSARDKVEKAQGVVNLKRHKEARTAAKHAVHEQPVVVLENSQAMDVDHASTLAEENPKKRKAEDDISAEDIKKARPGVS